MSIKAKELRIGNWICLPHGERQVIRISEDEVWVDYGDHGWDEGELIPITLTPEILEKCECDKHFCGTYHLKINKGGVLIGQRHHGVQYMKHVTHLHQLQNLYFALTGEELNYQP